MCGARTFETYCPDCKTKANAERHKKYDLTRNPESVKFYHSALWKKLRSAHLKAHPYCQWVSHDQMCKSLERLEVDHIIPREEQGPDTLANLQTLCHTHHTLKTSQETGSFKGRAEAWVITGPPGSGKTTYVNERLRPGDVVIDLDRITPAISATASRKERKYLMRVVWEMRDAAIAHISKARDIPRVYVIEGAPTRARRDTLRELLGATVIVLELPRAQCMKRIKKAKERDTVTDWQAAVDLWWSKYEPSSLDTVIRLNS